MELATAFGIFGVIANILWPLIKHRKYLLLGQVVACIFMFAHFYLLGAYTGAAVMATAGIQASLAMPLESHPKFKSVYPDISVALSLRDSEPRVTNFNSDIEVRMTPSFSQDDVQIKLADCRYKIFASKDYIKENGFPKTTNDLDYHKIISYGEDAQPPIDRHRLNWLLTIGKDNKRPRKPILEVSSIYGIAKATEVGMGIASLPDWMEFEMIELTEILSQLEGPKMSISLCFNYELRNDSRIKAFKDFMLKEAEVIN